MGQAPARARHVAEVIRVKDRETNQLSGLASKVDRLHFIFKCPKEASGTSKSCFLACSPTHCPSKGLCTYTHTLHVMVNCMCPDVFMISKRQLL